MEHLILDLEIQTLRQSFPFNQLSEQYCRTYHRICGKLPCIKTASAIVDLRERLKEKENVYFIDTIRYGAAFFDSSVGSPMFRTATTMASSIQSKTLDNVLNLKQNEKTNVVISLITETNIYYDILSKESKNVIAISPMYE